VAWGRVSDHNACGKPCPPRHFQGCRRQKDEQRCAIANTKQNWADYDAFIFGVPTRFGNNVWPDANSSPENRRLWAKGQLVWQGRQRVFASPAPAAARRNDITFHLTTSPTMAMTHSYRLVMVNAGAV